MHDIKRQLFLILFLTIVVYVNSFNNSFHFDDNYVIVGDNVIKDIHNLPVILSQFFQRPLLRATFAINYYIGGLHVFSYHLFNLFFHIAVSIEIYILCWLLLRKLSGKKDNSSLFPFLTALFFSLHPLHTGSVTYIASRSAVLSALFFLLSFILFLKAFPDEKHYKKLFLFLYGFTFLLGLGVKEIVATLPVVILAYTFVEFKGDHRSYLRKYFIPLSIGFILLGIYLLARHIMLDIFVPVDSGIYEGVLPRYHYLLTELNVIVLHYLKWLIVPIGGPYVDPDIPARITFFEIPTIASAIIIISLIFIAFRVRKKQPLLSFGIFWYFITLLPTSSIFPLGDVAVERHVYIPAIGFSLIVGYFLDKLREKLHLRVVLTIYALIFVLLMYLTIERNTIWRSELSLWEDAVKKSPHKVRVLNNRAYAYMLEGKLDMAEHYYKELIERFPEYPYGHNNLGTVYYRTERINEAIHEYIRAIQLRPMYALFRVNLGVAYERAGLFDEAEEEFNTALMLEPSNAKTMTFLASTLAKKGEFKKSIQFAQRSLEIQPNDPLAYYHMGYSYEKMGAFNDALNAYEKALKLKPGWEPPNQRMRGLLQKNRRQ